MRVGFIGLGVMGNLMAGAILKGGHHLTVHDINDDAASALRANGAEWAGSARAVGEAADVVFTSLPGPKEVTDVVFQAGDGLLEGLRPGSLFIDTTTNLPSLAREIAEACGTRGVDALDAPVSGRPPQFAMMVGGKQDVFDRYRGLLQDVATDVFYMGPTGSGMVAKGINQFLIFAGFLVAAEGLILGAKAGLDPYRLYETLQASAGGRSVRLDAFPRTVFPRAFGRDAGGGGPLRRWAKDVSCAVETAKNTKLDMPILSVAEERLVEAQDADLGGDVWYSVIQILEREAGVELRGGNSD